MPKIQKEEEEDDWQPLRLRDVIQQLDSMQNRFRLLAEDLNSLTMSLEIRGIEPPSPAVPSDDIPF